MAVLLAGPALPQLRISTSQPTGSLARRSTSHQSSSALRGQYLGPSDWPEILAAPPVKLRLRQASRTSQKATLGRPPAPACQLDAGASWPAGKPAVPGSDSWQEVALGLGERIATGLPRREVVVGAPLLALSAVAFSANAEPEPASTSQSESSIQVPKKVFVVGATGSTGKRIVRALLKRGVKVRAGVRSLEKAEQTFGPASADLEFVQTDVTAGVENLKAALGDADVAVCATGFSPGLDLTAAWKVDNLGTVALVDACLARGVPRFVLVSSILTNGAAWGQVLNPNYLLLNLFGLVLIAKLQAEKYIQRSGINYTIVRPGGLRNDPPSGNLIMSSQDSLSSGSVSRDTVAEVAVEALYSPAASYKIAEIVETADAPKKSLKELFAALR